MDTVNLYLRVRRRDLVFFNGLLESYDDLAVVKTLDPAEGIVAIMISPGREETAGSILDSIAGEVGLERLSPDGNLLALYREKIYGPR